MACLSFREATEVTFEAQRADNLHLRAQVDALTADLAQLREMYQDRDGDLAYEFERGNAFEAQNERLQEENERLTDAGVQYEHVQPNGKPVLIAENERLRAENVRLLAANERMSGAWLKHERLQPDGELWASLDEVLAENERLTAVANAQADTDTAMLDDVEPMLQRALALAEMRTAEVERLRAENELYRHISVELGIELEGENARLTAEVARLTAAQSHPAILRGPCSAQGGCSCDGDSDEDGDARPDGTIQYTIRAYEHKHVLREMP